MTTVLTRYPSGPVLLWLQNNIGPILHSQPIHFWHGDGWHMKWSSGWHAPSGELSHYFSVDFDNAEHATWFALLWG